MSRTLGRCQGKPLKSLKVIFKLSQFVLGIIPCRDSPITSRNAKSAASLTAFPQRILRLRPVRCASKKYSSIFLFFQYISMIFPVLLATLLLSLSAVVLFLYRTMSFFLWKLINLTRVRAFHKLVGNVLATCRISSNFKFCILSNFSCYLLIRDIGAVFNA